MKKSCLCCQSEDLTLNYKDVEDYEYHTYHPVNYLKCNRCGLLTQDPLPPSKQIPGFYNAQYRNHLTFGKPGLYRSLKYFKLWLLAAHISGFIDNKKDKKILEIGCGGGMLLFMLKKRGFIHLFGNDLSDSSQKDLSLYKISFKKGNAEEQFPFEGRFDLIILNHVFEHLLDPKSILAACCDHLNDKGKVIIIVPNADSLPSQVFGKFWDGINAPRHTYVFSKNSIESLKKILGFTPYRSIQQLIL